MKIAAEEGGAKKKEKKFLNIVALKILQSKFFNF